MATHWVGIRSEPSRRLRPAVRVPVVGLCGQRLGQGAGTGQGAGPNTESHLVSWRFAQPNASPRFPAMIAVAVHVFPLIFSYFPLAPWQASLVVAISQVSSG